MVEVWQSINESEASAADAEKSPTWARHLAWPPIHRRRV
jgi:hypothetical protein